jgi:hypothetical protein
MLDNWLIAKTQQGYLWLFDRTGVYCATLRLIFWGLIFLPDILRQKVDWIFAVIGGITLANHMYGYYLQDTKRYAVYNQYAEQWEDQWILRTIVISFITVASMLHDLTKGQYWDVPCDSSFIIWTYLSCSRIRDREPPEKEMRDVVWET